MLYHVSPTPGLTRLEPRISSHGKAYVYAVANLTAGLLFGAKQDDFDFIISTEDDGCTQLWECYPDAFAQVYKAKACSMYALPDEGFLRGQTGWDEELVCERAVEALGETRIDDLYVRLLEEETSGKLRIHRWEDNMAYKKRISAHIVDRLIRFNALEHFKTRDVRGKYYVRLTAALSAAMDGHLL